MSFIVLKPLWDGISSKPIKTKMQRAKIKARISQLKAKGEVVKCFRDSPGFLMMAHRRKRLDDFF
jgi:hypothetical protein